MHAISRFIRSSPRQGFVCSSCRNQIRHLWQPPAGKDQRSNYAAKVRNAEAAWEVKAKEIADGKRESMLSILESRGYINSIAGDRNELDKLMTSKRIGAYVGVDPTAPSLHLGHLLPIMALLWMYVEGFQAVTVLGGATSRVGDPTGRTTTRDQPHPSVRKANMASMHVQLTKLWARMESYATTKYGYEKDWSWKRGLVNNNDWMNKLRVMDFLRTIGQGSRVGTMLGRDTARTKLEKGDGLSYAEFSYPLLQAWDWWHLLTSRGVQMQIGGSDQFGNIIAGIDAVNYLAKNDSEGLPAVIQTMKPVGFTVPLLTTASGEKFGKSAGNAIWLDPDMTSSYELYQFCMRSADTDVGRYLKLFTLLPLPTINELLTAHETDPSARVAQRRLAREVVEMLHGAEAADGVEYDIGLLFRQPKTPRTPHLSTKYPDDINPSLNPNAPQTSAANAPSPNLTLPRSLVYDQPIARVLFYAGLVSSRSEGHRLGEKGGAYVGSSPSRSGGMGNALSFKPIYNWAPAETWQYVMEDSLLILRVGKWKVKIVKILADQEFDEQGLDVAGWREWKDARAGPPVGDSSK